MTRKPRPLPELIDLSLVAELFNHFSALTGLAVRLVDADGRQILASSERLAPQCEVCRMIHTTEGGLAHCAEDFLEGGREARRWGTPFYFECWLGLMEWTVPILVEDELVGVLVCGQVLMKDRDRGFREEVLRQTREVGGDVRAVNAAINTIRTVTPQQSRAAAELLQLIAYRVNEQGARAVEERRRQTQQQRRIAEAMHVHKQVHSDARYPIELEKQLVSHVCLGEVARAKEILNNLLGAIFFRDMGNNEVLKARLIELLAMVSRAAVEAGGEMEELLGVNLLYLQRLGRSETPEEMSTIMIEALNRFTEGVYRTRNTEQLRVLSDALAYIREHATGDLSIDDVATACHRNASTLRKLMREQLGTTFSDYVNRIRIERSIDLLKDPAKSLAEIAVEVGFYDQSHFGKVFRQVTGYTPALYRKKVL